MSFEIFRLRTHLDFIADPSATKRATKWPSARHRLPARALAARLVKAWHTWGEWRRERAMRAALASLDAMTLRDLGIRRSEIGSVQEEWSGRVEMTRMRIAPSHDEVLAPRQPPLHSDYFR